MNRLLHGLKQREDVLVQSGESRLVERILSFFILYGGDGPFVQQQLDHGGVPGSRRHVEGVLRTDGMGLNPMGSGIQCPAPILPLRVLK